MEEKKPKNNRIKKLLKEAPFCVLVFAFSIGFSIYALIKNNSSTEGDMISFNTPPIATLFHNKSELALGDANAVPVTGMEEDFFLSSIAISPVSATLSLPEEVEIEITGTEEDISFIRPENPHAFQAESSITLVDTATEEEEISSTESIPDTPLSEDVSQDLFAYEETDSSIVSQTVSIVSTDSLTSLSENIIPVEEELVAETPIVIAPDSVVNEEETSSVPKNPHAFSLSTPIGIQEYVAIPEFTPRCGAYDYTGVKPLTTTYPYMSVSDNSCFDDALFIGDSRVEGLYLYGGLPNATFAYKRGCSVSYIPTGQLNVTTTTTKTLAQILSEKQFGKVYIMVGVNELSGGNPAYYGTHYKTLVDMILSYQPSTKVFMFATMYVSQKISDSNASLNNDNIDSRSCRVAALVNGTNTFFLDMNPVIVDENGGVNPNYTWDGIHLKPEYYALWVQFMREHIVP